jgi:hypothetical protein
MVKTSKALLLAGAMAVLVFHETIAEDTNATEPKSSASESTEPASFFERVFFGQQLAQSSRQCVVGCNNEGQRCFEDCAYQAETAAEDVNAEEIDPLDSSAMLRRAQRLNQIVQERNRCQTRCNNETQRCGRACNAQGFQKRDDSSIERLLSARSVTN